MQEIRAAICRSFGAPLAIETVRLRPPAGREVEVAVEAVAICHSDISYVDGAWGGTLPAVYGHEAVGRVTATGPAVTDVQVGARVIVTLIRHCGTCPTCVTGHPVLCPSSRDQADPPLSGSDGEALLQGLACGAFAEAVVVDRSQVVPVPEQMAPEAACLISCGVLTGVGAVVNTGRLRPGEDVVVIGAGGVGLNAVQGARLAGARRIVAVDRHEEKLAAALEFGATDGVLADEAPWRAARAAIGRGADLVLVTVGVAAVYDSAPRYLAPGGRLVMVGMPPTGAMSSYEPVALAALGQGVSGSLMGDVVPSREVPWLADLYGQGRLKLDELVSGRWRLDQINEAMDATRSGTARRNVIVF